MPTSMLRSSIPHKVCDTNSGPAASVEGVERFLVYTAATRTTSSASRPNVHVGGYTWDRREQLGRGYCNFLRSSSTCHSNLRYDKRFLQATVPRSRPRDTTLCRCCLGLLALHCVKPPESKDLLGPSLHAALVLPEHLANIFQFGVSADLCLYCCLLMSLC